MNNPNNDIFVFDRKRIQQNRERCAEQIEQHNFLANWCADQLVDRLGDIKRTFPTALHIGARNDSVTSPKIGTLISMDLSSRLVKNVSGLGIVADEEFIPFTQNTFNLVLSTLNLHSVNDLPGTLLQIRRSLKPDGLFMAAILGGETLHELRQVLLQAEMNINGGASPRIFPFADKPQVGELLQRAGFNLPVVDSEHVTVTYDNIFKLLHDLRGMGEGNALAARDKTPPSKALFMEAARLYQEQFAGNDDRITATFEVIFMIGWAPHESQQKPLRPGSAEHSLADILGAQEIKTGEIASS